MCVGILHVNRYSLYLKIRKSICLNMILVPANMTIFVFSFGLMALFVHMYYNCAIFVSQVLIVQI